MIYPSGDPTVILNETLATPLGATHVHVAHPRERAFLAFDGDLLHGVLPGPFARARGGGGGDARDAAGGAPAQQRLTLLIAWYGEHTRDGAKRARLGAQGAVPRPSRSQTWPRDLELTEDEREMDSAGTRRAAVPHRVPLPRVAAAWAAVPPPADGGATAVEAPTSLRQHFFLHEANEVSDRLREEHGIGGSWDSRTAKRRR